MVAGITLTVTGNVQDLHQQDLDFLPRVPAFALILAQTCLIGLWAAMSRRVWWVRLLALGLNIAYLQVQLTFALDERWAEQPNSRLYHFDYACRGTPKRRSHLMYHVDSISVTPYRWTRPLCSFLPRATSPRRAMKP